MSKQISSKSNKSIGFGFDPAQNQHHFVVIIPNSEKDDVLVHECHSYSEDTTAEALHMSFAGVHYTGKVKLPRFKWNAISNFLKIEFNQRLKQRNRRHRSVQWKRGLNYVHRLFGKELMVLAWAIENAEYNQINNALENWLGLKPEERWWLYTMTNAATGHPINGSGRGWRKALRFALTENPVPEGRYTQGLLDQEKQMLFDEEKDYKTNTDNE